ncbi:MAG TPA: VOC family protein [Thermoleophilaceae bacterium]|nr:VOC family protein [Thermoleophilaceae bacterium]
MTAHDPQAPHTLTPNLVVDGGLEALEFYERAFGAEVVSRLEMDGQLMHAELRVGNSGFTVSDEFADQGFVAPEEGRVNVSLSLWVEDCDAVHARAVEAGATGTSAPADKFHGDRVGTIRCPFGHRWLIGTRIRDMSQEEMQKAMEDGLGG